MYRFTINIIILVSIVRGYQSIELYDRLHHLIGYVTNHTESQIPNLMLGIYMCEAQLLTMKKVNPPPTKVLESIKNLREQYENRTYGDSIWQLNIHSSIVIERLLNLSFWVKSLEANDNTFYYGNLTTNHKMFLTHDNFADYIDTGAPSPHESDECLAELLNTLPCTISSRCLQIMSITSESHGYHLTHKLLYYMIMKFRNCTQSLSPASNSLDMSIYTLCSFIWHERNLIVEMDIPNPLKDLFLEQTLLCGLNGFIAFIDEHVVNEIIEWQVMDSGCYIYYDGSLDSLKDEPTTGKKKRDAQQLNGNCSDHMTGLAAAAFGLFAKIANEFNEMVL